MSSWDDRRSPHTGFGDAINTSVKFQVMRRAREAQPNWTRGEARLTTFSIRHSNDVVTQVDGRGERELTVRLWLPDVASLDALDAVQGQAATLRYRWGITSRAGGSLETIAGVPYLTLPNTLLVRLSDQKTYIGGTAEAVATFRRAVG